MGFFQKLFVILGAKKENPVKHDEETTKKFHCAHGTTNHGFEIEVLGCKVEFLGSPLCIPCTIEYMNRNSTLCDCCKKPILPWTQVSVGKSVDSFFCANCGDAAGYCGEWGEGRLIGREELDELRQVEREETKNPKCACEARI